MTPFGTAMRQYLGRGLSPASAMRATWADVKRGSVARPPRGARRRNPGAGAFRVGGKAARRLMAWHGGQGTALYEAGSLATAGRPIGRDTFAAAARELEREAQRETGRRGALLAEQARRMRQALADNPKLRRLKYRGRVYDVLGVDPDIIKHPQGWRGYLVRRPREKSVQLARVTPGRVEYVTPVAQSVRQLGRPYKAAIRRYRGNPPNAYRAGELAARVWHASGGRTLGQLETIADAHAQVYGLPRGDVFEFARKFAGQPSLGGARFEGYGPANPPRGWRKTAGGWRTTAPRGPWWVLVTAAGGYTVFPGTEREAQQTADRQRALGGAASVLGPFATLRDAERARDRERGGNPPRSRSRSVMMLEDGTPIVRHTFYGRTPADVRAIERAHVAADASLRAALAGRRYRGVAITARRENPLTRAETLELLRVARDDMRLSRRLPSLTATGRADPRVRERHIGFWRGRADGLLGVVGTFGSSRRLSRERSGRVPFARRGASLSRIGVGPGLNPVPRIFKYRGRRLLVIGRDPRAPGVWIAQGLSGGTVYAVRSSGGRIVSVTQLARDESKLRPEYRTLTALARGTHHRTLDNPAPVLIYDRVNKIFATKGRGPHRGQRFVHHFTTRPRMLGLPNGDLLITGRR